MIAKLFSSRRSRSAPGPSIPSGERVYAIGDIHGRLDLLDSLLTRIDADDAARGPARTTIIVLGDLVDRGPDSAGVVQRLRLLATQRGTMRFLLGNHEEIFLGALAGESKSLRLFCRIGGRETALSYGVDETRYERLDYAELAQVLADIVPADDRVFLKSFEDMIVIGDYVFVHAGLRPGVPLDAQKTSDLRWIREPFLDHRGHLGKVVVHGHTIVDEPELRPHRIGIDTGAYATGRLTALGLESGTTWLLTS